MKSKTVKTGIALLTGVILFVAVLYFIGIKEIIRNIIKINIGLYLLSMGCIFVSISLWVMRWKVFIEANGEDVAFWGLFQNLIIGFSINNLTPVAKMGGEPVRAYLLKKKEGIKMRRGLATILAELTVFFTFTILVVVLSVILITLTLSPPFWINIILIMFIFLASLGFMGILGIYSDQDVIIKILNWFGKKIKRINPYKERILSKYKEFQKTFKDCLDDKKTFSKALTYTVVARVFDILKFFLLFLSLDFYFGPIKILIGMGIAAILMTVPATPGSLGIFEGGMISVFVMLGAPAGVAATVVFLDRLVWYWMITIVGGSLGAYQGIDIIETKKGIKED